MAKHSYVTGALFDDDDESEEEDNSSFRGRIPPSHLRQTANFYEGHIADVDKQKQLALQKKLEIEQRTLESATRSISLLCETENIGNCAAIELAHQGEQLHNTNLKLDEVDTNLKISQKHINGIKSVFYEFKNFISGKSKLVLSKTRVPSKMHSSDLNNSRSYDKKVDSSQRNASLNKFESPPATHVYSLDVQSTAEPHTSTQNVNDILEANLDEIAQHVTKLKGLGVEFGFQINHQNELIDTIQNKVEVADMKIEKQNKQMNSILGK